MARIVALSVAASTAFPLLVAVTHASIQTQKATLSTQKRPPFREYDALSSVTFRKAGHYAP